MHEPLRTRYDATGVQEMWQVAQALARHYRTHGGVIALHGELGAGKTTLMQGFAAALGVSQPVTSPTFALVLEYPLPGGRRLVHMDLYRLQGPADLEAIGFEEYLASNAIIAIEWAERAGGLLPDETLFVNIRIADDNRETRQITLENISS